MISKWLSFGFILLGCVSCQASLPATKNERAPILQASELPNSVPFEITDASAFITPNTMSVYLYGNSDDVIIATFDLPKSEHPNIEALISSSNNNSVTHFNGPNIRPYLVPAGVAVPFPADYAYTKRNAVSGTLICKNTPSEYSKIKGPIIFSFEDVTFNDGAIFQITPRDISVGIFPP